MPAGSRFGPQILGGPFSHTQQSHLPLHVNQQHHPHGSASLPPPSFPSQFGLPHSNQGNALANYGAINGVNGLGGAFGGGPGLGRGGTGLASHAAQAGFAHGMQLQAQQQQREALRRGGGMGKGQNKSRIRDVWTGNLAQEMQNLRELVDKYPYISMDTEFPGVVVRPMGHFTSKADYHYQTLRSNVDLLNVIQLGITLFNEDGETPPPHAENGPYQNSQTPCPSTWQFNFRFNLEEDMFNQESIDFLQSVGLNMELHESQGIDPHEFGALLITSGLVMLDDVRWISFHAGYDFAYLIKIMYCKALPETEAEYRKLFALFFPSLYDIKYMIKTVQRSMTINNNHSPLTTSATNTLQNLGTKSGLQDLADELGIRRIGTAHTAGSDSLLTGKIFWEVKKAIFQGVIDDDKYLGQVWGLAAGPPASKAGTGIEGQTTPNLNGAVIYTSNGTPSTPKTASSAPVQTPQQTGHGNGASMGSLTPGAGGALFGRFAMGGANR